MIQQIDNISAFKILNENKNSFLIDVRTKGEWEQVGIVDDSGMKNKSTHISWKILPQMTNNQNFLQEVDQYLQKFNIGAEDKKQLSIMLICKSGGRSQQACEYLQSCGYQNLYNISGGFEGLDNNGWKYILPITNYLK